MNNTQLKEALEKVDFQKVFNKLGYAFFTKGTYNVNIFGIRNLTKGTVQDDTFNDFLCCIYNVKDSKGNLVQKVKIWEGTTDPGLKALKSPTDAKGTAILVPGQYRSVYKIDYHRGKYKALCQRFGSVKVYRDGNKDNNLDFNPIRIESGIFGINIHKAAEYARETISGYSYGCQVFRNAKDFNSFMDICKKSAELYGNKFTYTLITTDEIKKCGYKL